MSSITLPKLSKVGTLPSRAVTYRSYSTPPEMTTIFLPTSGPDLVKPNEVLIKTTAASVNPIDLMLHAATPSFIGPKVKTMGGDFAGVVVKAGAETKYKPGDRVWGDNMDPVGAGGAFSEFLLLDDKNAFFLDKIPEGMTDNEGSSLGVAYCTGFGAITSHVNNAKGGKVLILGGGSVVGCSAIQFAKYYGAKEIVVTCSPRSAAKAKQYGADVTVDYTNGSELNGILEACKDGPFDLIVDAVRDPVIHGHFSEMLKPAKEDGLYVLIDGPSKFDHDSFHYIYMLPSFAWMKEALKEKLGLSPFQYKRLITGTDGDHDSFPNAVKDIWAKKQLKIDIDSTYKFDNFKEALDRVAKGKAKGKVVMEF